METNHDAGSGGGESREEPRIDEESRCLFTLTNVSPGVILVPSDLSVESDYAVELGGLMAAHQGVDLIVLYVLRDEIKEKKEYRESKLLKRLQRQTREVPSEVQVHIQITPGNDVVRVVQCAKQHFQASLVLLGSHSARDRMKFKVSKSLRIVREGTVPYVLVQALRSDTTLQKVVIPLDYTDEDIRDFRWLENLERYYHPEFHILLPQVDDIEEEEMNAYLCDNLEDLLSCLDHLGARYQQHVLDEAQEFSASIVDYAKRELAGLIVLTTAVDPREENCYMLEPHVRRVILHADNIPVMLVNPEVEEA